jgi:archaellum component FlaC
MWIVKNTLRATLTLGGLDVSIADGEEFDLDTIGRDVAEDSNQVQVAFEEGYLQNVRKEAIIESAIGRGDSAEDLRQAGMSTAISVDQLDAFKSEFMDELRSHLPRIGQAPQGGDEVTAAISADVKELVTELKSLKGRFASIKGRVTTDDSLSKAEIKARLAFLDEQERELLKNFESVGKQVEGDDGDVMDMADMLSNL